MLYEDEKHTLWGREAYFMETRSILYWDEKHTLWGREAYFMWT